MTKSTKTPFKYYTIDFLSQIGGQVQVMATSKDDAWMAEIGLY